MPKNLKTQQYQAQIDDLLAQKSFIEKVNNVLPSAVYIFDLKTQSIVYVNEQVRDILGFAPDEFKKMAGNFYAQVMHPDDIPRLHEEQVKALHLKDNEVQELEYRVRRQGDNSYRWVSDRVMIFSRDGDDPHMILGVATDIDDRKRADEELRITAQKMMLSLEAAHMGTWEWDEKNGRLYWDRRMYELHDALHLQHLPITEIIQEIMLEEDWEITSSQSYEALKNHRAMNLTYRIRNRAGEIRTMRSYGRVLSTLTNGNMSGVGWDITEEARAEQTMAEARAAMISSTKMAALGEMSGGIAHEINNPLTVIQARAFQLSQMIEMDRIDPLKIQQAADAISRTAEKIARIIKSLRSFSRDGAHDPFDLVSVSQIMNETLEFCRTRFYHHSIDIQVQPIPEDLEIECRQVQIGQVLLNLLNNSFDALAETAEKWIRVEVLDKESEIEIRSSDSGPGIPQNILDKIMDPFFTTKEVGKGTGLGLSISTGIIKSHNGNLWVDTNQPNTTFVIRLPKIQVSEF